MMVCICCKHISAERPAEEADGAAPAAPAMPTSRAWLGPFNEAKRRAVLLCSLRHDRTARCNALVARPASIRCRDLPFMRTRGRPSKCSSAGETGISRLCQRTWRAMKEAGISDPPICESDALGVIDLPTIQKKLTCIFAVARICRSGSRPTPQAFMPHQGPYKETQIDDDPPPAELQFSRCLYTVNGEIKRVDEPALTALKIAARGTLTPGLRQGHCCAGNKIISEIGLSLQADAALRRLPPRDRELGYSRGTPDGVLIDDALEQAPREWMPSPTMRFHRLADDPR